MKPVFQSSEDKAVSPIIATIILIAITIVIAATLYTALTFYANSTQIKPPDPVEISATLTEKCFINSTVCHLPYGDELKNNTTFYELYINSISGCNGNISLIHKGFRIYYKNGSESECCLIDPHYLNNPLRQLPSYECSINVSNYGSCYFVYVNFHPVVHMIPGSIFLFNQEKYTRHYYYLPTFQIYSIKFVNLTNNNSIFEVNIS